MDRNSKEINLAKLNLRIIITKHVSCNMLFTFLEKSITKKYYSERDYLKHLD